MRFAWSFAGALVLALARTAAAQEAPIAEASEAWEVGEVEKAGKLYEQALAAGGLSPSDTLTAFVRVGVWRASTGKNEAALNAFRNAALIDPGFEYPSEGGPRGKPLYDRARKQAAGQAKLVLEAEAPATVASGKSFKVVGNVPEAMVPLFDGVTVHVQDKAGKLVYVDEHAADVRVEFEVAGDAVKPGALLEVRIAVVDAQKNEWARATASVKVKSAPPPIAAAEPPPPPPPSSPFWSTKWPFVIGGAVVLVTSVVVVATVAGGGSDVVTVRAPAWQPGAISR